VELDAIILADDPLAQVRIAGLTASERATRVARRVGATRVFVVRKPDDRAELVAWRGERANPLLVIRANQLVHTPLVQPLVAALPSDGIVAAVGDLTGYAGAFATNGAATKSSLAALARGESDATIARDATPITHGEIACAPISTPAERRAAHRLLYRILVKPQDNAITRYLYRPVSFPLTRLLVWTPITPNQISYLVALLVAIGCWITATRSPLAGTIVVLAASYLDCCDGEVARVKLLSSRFGAWIDTVVDEASSVGYMIALGIYCLRTFGDHYPWSFGIALGTVTYVWTMYCIYYNIIVAVGSANSQDYVGRFDVAPGKQPSTVRLVPVAPKAIATTRELPAPIAWMATYLPYTVRRDFLSWAAVGFVALGLTHLMFAGLVAGGVVTAIIVTIDHAKLRSLRRSCARRGLVVEAP
jgi:phosphatidylglycerophosphate synthase